MLHASEVRRGASTGDCIGAVNGLIAIDSECLLATACFFGAFTIGECDFS